VFAASASELRDAERWAFLPRLEPAAFSILGPAVAGALPGLPGDGFSALLVLEDDRPWVDRQTELATAALGPAIATFEGDAVVALTQALTDRLESAAERAVFTTAWNSPAALGVLLDDRAARTIAFHTLAGRLHLESHSKSSAVQRLAGYGFTAIEARGPGAAIRTDAPLGATTALRARLRAALDPREIWAYGPRWQGSPAIGMTGSGGRLNAAAPRADTA